MEFRLNEDHRNISNAELLDDIKRVANVLNKNPLTQSDYKRLGKYSTTTIRRRFGGWNIALELCGMQANIHQLAATLSRHKHQNVETQVLLNDIKRVASLLNKKSISSAEYTTYGSFSRDICFRRFSTWNEALEQAGLNPYKFVPGKRIDDETLLREIERVWIQLGRQPTASDIKAGVSRFSLHTYTSHFGGWRGALQAFIRYIESPHTEIPLAEDLFLDDRSCAIRNIKIEHNRAKKSYHKTPRDVNYRLRFKVMQRDNFKCCICGNSPAKNPGVELHVDHIIPWSKGGETIMENLQTLCSTCNLGKSDLDM